MLTIMAAVSGAKDRSKQIVHSLGFHANGCMFTIFILREQTAHHRVF